MTAHDDPALGGVYKLGLITRAGRAAEPRIKLGEDSAKITTPGVQQVRRFFRSGKFVADAIYDERVGCDVGATIVDPVDPIRRRALGRELAHVDLLEPALRAGRPAGARPPLAEIRQRAQTELAALDPSVRRLMKPHTYPVGLTEDLYQQRLRLIEQGRERHADAAKGAVTRRSS